MNLVMIAVSRMDVCKNYGQLSYQYNMLLDMQINEHLILWINLKSPKNYYSLIINETIKATKFIEYRVG